MEIFKKIKNSKFFKLFSNLYVLTSLVFFIWIFFIDSNSILVNLELKKEITELNERKSLLEKQIEIDKKIHLKFYGYKNIKIKDFKYSLGFNKNKTGKKIIADIKYESKIIIKLNEN